MAHDAAWWLTMQEMGAVLRASNERDENDWQRTLLTVNHIRGFAGGDPLTIDDLKEDPQDGVPTPEEFEQMKRGIEERRRKAKEA